MYLRACLVICLLQILACAAIDVKDKGCTRLRVSTKVPNFYYLNDDLVKVFVNATHQNGTLVDGEVTVYLSISMRRNSTYEADKVHFLSAPAINETVPMVQGRAVALFNISIFSPYFELRWDFPFYLLTTEEVHDANSCSFSYTYDVGVIYRQRHHIECVSNSTCATFKPNQPQEVVAKITYLNAGPVNSTEQLAYLTYTGVLKEISGEDLNYLYTNEADVVPRTSSNIILHFKSRVDEHGFAKFNVTLPDLPDYPGYDHFFELAMTYKEAQTTYTCTQLNTVEVSNLI